MDLVSTSRARCTKLTWTLRPRIGCFHRTQLGQCRPWQGQGTYTAPHSQYYAQSKSKEQAWHLWCCDYSLYKAVAPLAVLLVWITVENYVLARGCTNNTLCAHTSLCNFSEPPLNSTQEKHACIEHPRRLCTVAVDTCSTICSGVVSYCNQHCH